MRRRKLVLVVVAVTVSAIAVAPTAGAAPNAVPGTMVLRGLPGTEWTWAVDINNSYVVIGTNDFIPVRWDSVGRVTELPVPPDLVDTVMREVTDSGFIIGDARRYDQGGTLTTALLWDPQGNRIDLQYPPGSSQTHATDVNNAGVVVGTATTADGQVHAVRWDPQGQVTELQKRPGGDFSHAAAINDRGTVAGYSDVVVAGTHFTHAVKWSNAGQISVLGGSTSAMNSQALAINNSETVAGVQGAMTIRWDQLGRATVLQPPALPTAMNEDGVVVGQVGEWENMQPIRWDQQGRGILLSRLGYPTRANSINRAGTIVGTSSDRSSHPGSWAFSRAAHWDPAGKVTDLGDPVGVLNAATGINDKGAICGSSGDLNGPTNAVVWHRWSHTSNPR
ncbi:MAG: hypothetical protein WBA97_35995 [Actinophytocola sp.]|uniref:hypothetical protein n=1 Tax=Actinophytocola sp. TaxID=1872138 RepID=UPI003C711C19